MDSLVEKLKSDSGQNKLFSFPTLLIRDKERMREKVAAPDGPDVSFAPPS